jgi:nitroreductase
MLIDLLRNRRSIRRYQDKPVEAEKIDLLVEAMLRSPSSRSLNPWEFVVVEDPALLGELARAKAHGSSFTKGAPLAIVICADPGKCDVWVEDCSIATLLVHLAAADLGLGSCWIQLRERQHDSGKSSESYVKELLGLDDHLAVLAMVAIGYPAEEKAGHPADSLLWERVKRLS